MGRMLKFTCERCGGRIAVQARHLNRIVACPVCGFSTHPLASQLAAARQGEEPATPAAPPRVAPAVSPAERLCGNCGRSIGQLQSAKLWEGNPVCASCFRSLSEERADPGDTRTLSTLSLPHRTGTQTAGGGDRVVVSRELVPVAGNDLGTIDAVTNVRPPTRVTVAAAEGLHVVPLTWAAARGRLMPVLTVICVLAVAVYGALTLLRELAGIIATVALLVLAAVVLWLLLRTSLAAGRRFVGGKFAGSVPSTADNADLLARGK